LLTFIGPQCRIGVVRGELTRFVFLHHRKSFRKYTRYNHRNAVPLHEGVSPASALRKGFEIEFFKSSLLAKRVFAIFSLLPRIVTGLGSGDDCVQGMPPRGIMEDTLGACRLPSRHFTKSKSKEFL
jgi:hypothetical protein